MSQMVAARASKQAQSTPASPKGVLQRKCDKCRKREPLLQRAAAGPTQETVPPIVHEVLRSPGQPLDASTRAFMEPRFGRDFSRVQLRTESLKSSLTGLTVSQPGDNYEHEADRIARQVTHGMVSQIKMVPIPPNCHDFSRVSDSYWLAGGRISPDTPGSGLHHWKPHCIQ